MLSDESVLTLFRGLDERRQGEFVQLMRLANARPPCVSATVLRLVCSRPDPTSEWQRATL